MNGVDVWIDSEKIGTILLNEDGNTLTWIGDKARMQDAMFPAYMMHDGVNLLRYLLSHSGTRTQFLPVEEVKV